MKKLEVFGSALCCSTGVCGTEVEQALVDFEFVNNTKAKTFLEKKVRKSTF